MIIEVSSNLPTFKTLKFKKGLNILLANRHKNSTERDTRNGVGKTSLIELVHFVLSEKRSPNDEFHKVDLAGYEYNVRFKDNNKEYTVIRKSGAKNDETKLDDKVIEPKDLRVDLMSDWFGLSEQYTKEKYSPKFSALLSYFARKERNGGFTSPAMNSSQQKVWDSQVCLSYLLGFDWHLPRELQIKKDDKKRVDALCNMMKSGYLDGGDFDLKKMQARLDILDVEIKEKRDEINSATVVDGYRQHEISSNELTVTIRDLNEANLEDLDLIENINQALNEERDTPIADIENLYNQVEVFFGEHVKQRLDKTVEFHKKVRQNRKAHLERERDDAEARQKDRNSKINGIQAILAPKLGLLRSGIAIERLALLQSGLNELEAEYTDLSRRIPRFKNIIEDQKKLKRDIDDLVDAIGEDVEARVSQRKQAVRIFLEMSKFLYDESGSLTVGRSKGIAGLSIETNIPAGKSGGKNHMQIFCFDWLLVEVSLRQEKFPGFLVHDSHIFDGVDGRQIMLALEKAQKKCEELGVQYIVAMNSDDLEKIENQDEEFNPRDYILETELTDEPNGGLFGMRF